MIEIAQRSAVNKTAALVTSRSSESKDSIKVEDDRKALGAAIGAIQNKLSGMKKDGPRRQKLIGDLVTLQQEKKKIDELFKRIHKDGLADYILRELKPRYTKFEWKRIVDSATVKFLADQKD